MKKILPMVLAAALVLSLTACGGTDKASGKEALLEEAMDCDFGVMQTSYEDNMVNAEDTYIGNTYRFTGYVIEITENSATLVPLNAPAGFLSGAFGVQVKASLSKDDIKELSKSEVVNIVGQVSGFDGGDTLTVNMDTAYYVDNLVTFTGTVEGFALDGSYKLTTIEGDMQIIGDDPITLVYHYLNTDETIDLSEAGAVDAFNQETLQGVELVEGDTVTITGTLEFEITTYLDLGGGLRSHSRELNVTSVNSVEKAQ